LEEEWEEKLEGVLKKAGRALAGAGRLLEEYGMFTVEQQHTTGFLIRLLAERELDYLNLSNIFREVFLMYLEMRVLYERLLDKMTDMIALGYTQLAPLFAEGKAMFKRHSKEYSKRIEEVEWVKEELEMAFKKAMKGGRVEDALRVIKEAVKKIRFLPFEEWKKDLLEEEEEHE